jgi:hypothetical protein
MPIRFACPNCSTVYKTTDEHAGRKTVCKQCGAVVVIPEPVREVVYGVPLPPDGAVEPSPEPTHQSVVPAAPTPAPVSNGRPDPTPQKANSGRRNAAAVRRPDAMGELRARRSRRARNRLLLRMFVVAALGVTCVILAQKVIQKARDIENATEAAEGNSSQESAPWEGSLNGTERKIVGVWSEVHIMWALSLLSGKDFKFRERWESTTTYRRDRRFVTKARRHSPTGDFLGEISFEGNWKVEGDNLVHSITKSQIPELLPVGFSVAEPIVSVSDTTLITRDSATGEQSVARRTR